MAFSLQESVGGVATARPIFLCFFCVFRPQALTGIFTKSPQFGRKFYHTSPVNVKCDLPIHRTSTISSRNINPWNVNAVRRFHRISTPGMRPISARRPYRRSSHRTSPIGSRSMEPAVRQKFAKIILNNRAPQALTDRSVTYWDGRTPPIVENFFPLLKTQPIVENCHSWLLKTYSVIVENSTVNFQHCWKLRFALLKTWDFCWKLYLLTLLKTLWRTVENSPLLKVLKVCWKLVESFLAL